MCKTGRNWGQRGTEGGRGREREGGEEVGGGKEGREREREVCSDLTDVSFLSSSIAKFSVLKAELWVVT